MAMYQNSQKSPLGSLISLGKPTNHKIAFTRYGDEDHDIFGNATQVEHFYSSTPNTCIVSIEPDSSREPPMGGVAESYFIMTLSGDTSSTRIYRFLDPLKSGNTEGLYLLSAKGTTWGSVSGTLSNQTDLQNALDNKVLKSGDTMTGALTINNSVSDTPLTLKGNSSTSAWIAFKNSSDTALGWLGVKNNNGDIRADVYYNNTSHPLAYKSEVWLKSEDIIYGTSGDGAYTWLTKGHLTIEHHTQNTGFGTMVQPDSIYVVTNRTAVKLGPTVLWTNPSPTASFASQNITLNQVLRDYDYFSVICTRRTTYSELVSSGYCLVGRKLRMFMCANYNYVRNFSDTDETGTSMTISDCSSYRTYGSGTQTTDNGYLIPYKIIGWKFHN